MRRDQQRRILVLGTMLLALAVAARHVTKRGFVASDRAAAQTPASVEIRPPTDVAIGDRSELVHLARQVLEAGGAEIPADTPDQPAIALASLSRQKATALVATGFGSDPRSAVMAATAQLARRASEEETSGGRLKLDLVTAMGEEMKLADGPISIERSLQGLWLPEIGLLLLPEELEARRLIDSDGDLRHSRLKAYLMEGGREARPELVDAPIRRFRTVELDSFAEGDRTEAPGPAPPIRLYRGNDRSPEVSPQALLEAARRGGDYLRFRQLADGSFVYSYDAKKNSIDDDDNLLRRAGTCYSLVQLYRASRPPSGRVPADVEAYLTTARRGLAALLDDHTQPVTRPGGKGALEAVVSPGDQLKLGGSALLLLALMEYQDASGDRQWLERGQSLARFLEAQQEPDGHFISKVSLEGERSDFESGYYPGEAILALTRLYRTDGDPRWLEVARRGADWLIDVRDAGKKTRELAHDHWLLMALDQLDGIVGDERYRNHARRIAEAILTSQRRSSRHLDWIGSFYDPPRSTPTATRGEALVAMVSLARRHGEETRPYVEALLRMAAFQRRCQLDELSAMYLERPDLAVGGFRRSLTHYEIRIDYVQHNISAFLGLREILRLDARSAPAGTGPEVAVQVSSTGDHPTVSFPPLLPIGGIHVT